MSDINVFIGKIWFESFEFHLLKRKQQNHVVSKKQYVEIIVDTILNYDAVFYSNEKNSYGKWIDKLYFAKENWTTVIKFNEYNKFKIITSFRFDKRYKDIKGYFIKRKMYLDVLEVKDGDEYKGIIKRIQNGVRS